MRNSLLLNRTLPIVGLHRFPPGAQRGHGIAPGAEVMGVLKREQDDSATNGVIGQLRVEGSRANGNRGAIRPVAFNEWAGADDRQILRRGQTVDFRAAPRQSDFWCGARADSQCPRSASAPKPMNAAAACHRPGGEGAPPPR